MSSNSFFSVCNFLNSASESEIFRVLKEYGEENHSAAIAYTIVKNRPLENVKDLVYLIRCCTPYGIKTINQALSRIFQALRIYSNNEMEELQSLLDSLKNLSSLQIAIITFHSLEDRIVKNWLNKNCDYQKVFYPSYTELNRNPQSRSAKLRYGIIK